MCGRRRQRGAAASDGLLTLVASLILPRQSVGRSVESRGCRDGRGTNFRGVRRNKRSNFVDLPVAPSSLLARSPSWSGGGRFLDKKVNHRPLKGISLWRPPLPQADSTRTKSLKQRRDDHEHEVGVGRRGLPLSFFFSGARFSLCLCRSLLLRGERRR